MRVRFLAFILITLMLSSTPARAADTGFKVSGGYIHVYFKSYFTRADKQKLLHWLKESAQIITTLYGTFPVKQTHVNLFANTRANEPVPWGEVWKNGHYRVNFHVNPRYSLQSFLDDWTATHEFSHLIHPYPGSGNAWFGEGLASYYQNILRARQGAMTEQQAWQKLLEGFQRGERVAAHNRMTLQEASWNMRQTASFGHVYWGGAAYFLAVDVRLRQQTGGKQSLDSAWFQFKQCCLSVHSNWRVEEVIQKLDQLTGTTVFTDEYNNVVDSLLFPDYRHSFRQLGITVDRGEVLLNRSSMLRASIMTANNFIY